MPKQPLAEVFGFPINDFPPQAERHRKNRLCPYNNRVANCTKDKANDPLGVCSIFEYDDHIAITCPIHFRQDWLIADDAAGFFFPPGTNWTSLTEVRLNDKNGQMAGNIDIVLVAYNERGRVTDFGALEVQAVYISGNVRRPFEHFMTDPVGHHHFSQRCLLLNVLSTWRQFPSVARFDILVEKRGLFHESGSGWEACRKRRMR